PALRASAWCSCRHDPPALPSFPTRRSSDLGLRGGLVAVEGIGVLHGEFAAAHQAEARPALVAEFGLDMVEIHRQLAPAVDLVAGDRKSTRLNSSHVKISYAVFCLKKKRVRA